MDEAECIRVDQKKIDEFMLNNKKRYEIITTFQKYLSSIDTNTFQEIIDFIDSHTDIFFKDHPSFILFYNTIITFSSINFLKLELILDIIIHYAHVRTNNEINASENELFDLSLSYANSINYLFSKNFFSIETIKRKTSSSHFILINFLPELETLDPEFVKLRLKQFILINDQIEDTSMKQFYKTVISDYSKHIINRNMNYHPSPIHKSIRDDDIDKFQQLISQTNYELNSPLEFSFYERTKTKEDNITLIKIASIYRSIKIFKFLMMQDVSLDDDFMHYAFWSCDSEIIHLSEGKATIGDSGIQSLFIHNQAIFEYFIENYPEKVEEKNDEVKNLLLKNTELFDENDECDSFKNLNYQLLVDSVLSSNYPIVLANLKKIAFLVKYYEMADRNGFSDDDSELNEESILSSSLLDFDLFLFLFTQKKKELKLDSQPFIKNLFFDAIDFNANDSFKYLFNMFYDQINLSNILNACMNNNSELSIFILDTLIEDKNKDDSPSGKFFNLRKQIDFMNLTSAILFYNEEVIEKLFQLGDLINTKFNVTKFFNLIISILSPNMCLSLFKKISPYLHPKTNLLFASAFNEKGYPNVADFLFRKYQV